MIPVLPLDLRPAWEEYERLRKIGLRKQANTALDSFLEKLGVRDDETVRQFVFSICRQVLDKGKPFIIQHPLYNDVMLPVLWEGYELQRMPETRWLAQSLGLCGATRERLDEVDLMRMAIVFDPNDELAWRLLIEYQMDALDFASRTLPRGLGIPEDECLEALEEINAVLRCKPEFRADYLEEVVTLRHVFADWTAFKEEGLYADFDDWCEAHNRHYWFL